MEPYSWPLQTDLYELTMAYGYWKTGMDKREAVFNLFYRKEPFDGGFAVSCGLDSVIRILDGFHFSHSDIEYLSGLLSGEGSPLFEEGFLDYLGNLRLELDIDAIPEGRLVFPHEPLIRVKGPLVHAQLLETILLTLVNFQTLIATKGARVRLAARDDEIMEFGLRRAQGLDGGLTGSRASYVGGADGTSNTLAGKVFDIPVKGTHAHSWIMAFDTELESFQAYAEAMPDNVVLLVDTYDTIEGVRNAIEVGLVMKEKGKKLRGIRLDSGDLLSLSLKAKEMLNEAGLSEVKIVASNELDEYRIADLKKGGSPISIWGVGTRLATGHPQAALGGVYKLAMVTNKQGEWVPKLKTSEEEEKMSDPGFLQVRRYWDNEGKMTGDLLLDAWDTVDENAVGHRHGKTMNFSGACEDLLKPIYRQGKRVYEIPSIHTSRANMLKELSQLPKEMKRLENPEQYPVAVEEQLYQRRLAMADRRVAS